MKQNATQAGEQQTSNRVVRDSFTSKRSLLPPLLTGLFVGLCIVPECFSSAPFHNWDLHAHISLTRRLSEQLIHGRILFYDPWWFTGWPAFSFYPPLGHIISALLSFPLSIFSDDPARLSCQMLVGLALSLLPISMFLCARKLLPRAAAHQNLLLAFSTSLSATWFLSHPDYFYSLGSLAGTHLGLLSQVLAWHCLLFYLGCIFHLLEKHRLSRATTLTAKETFCLCLAVSGLLLMHSLTFLFGTTVGLCLLLWNHAPKSIFLGHILGVGIAAPWLVPALINSKIFAPLDSLPAQGDFVSLVLQQRPQDMVQNLLPANFFNTSHLPLLILIGIAFLPHPRIKSQPLLLQALFFLLLTQAFFVSSTFSNNFPISLHLYRFLGLALLIFISLFALLPAHLATTRRLSGVIISLLLLLQIHESMLWMNQPKEDPTPARLDAEFSLLQNLRTNTAAPAENRVLFEFAAAGETPNYPSPHFLFSELEHLSHRETGNGLFIQSSLSQAFFLNTATQLKLNFYGSPELTSVDEHFTPSDHLAQLRDFGFSTLVSTKPPERSLMTASATPPIETFGAFSVYNIGAGAPVIQPAKKRLIGYLDREGSLPFKVVEYVFYSHKTLWEESELIEIQVGEPVPAEVRLILINDRDPQDFAQITAELVSVSTGQAPSIRNIKFAQAAAPPSLQAPSAQESLNQLIQNARLYLIEQLKLPDLIVAQLSLPAPSSAQAEAEFDWGEQSIRLKNLTPGRLVRINYSFSRGWSSAQGRIYRGSQERLWFLPSAASATLEHRALNFPGSSPGLLIGLLSLLGLIGLVFRQRFVGGK